MQRRSQAVGRRRKRRIAHHGRRPRFGQAQTICLRRHQVYGYIPYAEMMSVAKGCDISVNAIHSYAMQSITNKLSDYMALQKTDSEQPGQRRSCRSPYPAATCELPFRRCGRFRSSRQRYFEAQKRSCSVRRNRPPLQTRRCLSKNRQSD